MSSGYGEKHERGTTKRSIVFQHGPSHRPVAASLSGESGGAWSAVPAQPEDHLCLRDGDADTARGLLETADGGYQPATGSPHFSGGLSPRASGFSDGASATT